MTKKEYCLNNKPVAYYSGFTGIEINGIEYGIDDYLYCTSGAWSSKKSYHKLKIRSDRNGESYVILHGYRVPMSECMRTEV